MSGEDSTSLASKCMAFCQTLASQGQVFNFSLSIGPDFSFSLDTSRSMAVKTQGTKKRSSPSTLRRNARRRAEFNAKKQQSSPSRISSGENRELLPSPEKERGPQAPGELQLSPNHVQREEIKLSEQEGASSPLLCAASPPPPSLRYGCNKWMCTKTFTSEDDLRIHVHEYHSMCNREMYSTPCPWKRCRSRRPVK